MQIFYKLSDYLKKGLNAVRLQAMELLHPQKYEEFLESLQGSVPLHSASYNSSFDKACRARDVDSARNWAVKMQRVAPMDPEGWLAATTLDLICGDKAGALENATIAMEKNSANFILKGPYTDIRVLQNYHDALLLNGRNGESLEVLKKINKQTQKLENYNPDGYLLHMGGPTLENNTYFNPHIGRLTREMKESHGDPEGLT